MSRLREGDAGCGSTGAGVCRGSARAPSVCLDPWRGGNATELEFHRALTIGRAGGVASTQPRIGCRKRADLTDRRRSRLRERHRCPTWCRDHACHGARVTRVDASATGGSLADDTDVPRRDDPGCAREGGHRTRSWRARRLLQAHRAGDQRWDRAARRSGDLHGHGLHHLRECQHPCRSPGLDAGGRRSAAPLWWPVC